MAAVNKMLHREIPGNTLQNPFILQPESQIPLRTLDQWEEKKSSWKSNMASIMGALPSRTDLKNPVITFKDSVVESTYTKYNISFASDARNSVTAFLYIPNYNKEKAPAMLVLHSTGDLGKKIVDGQGPLENRAIARELAERGYVVIAPDYPSFGDQMDHDFSIDGFESGTILAIWNHMRCVDALVQLDEVDPERIGVIGHSLGGHNALFVAAHDPRLKTVVTSCGWTPFDYYDIGEAGIKNYGGRLGPWSQDRYMPAIKKMLPEAHLPFDFTHIIASIAPRPVFTNAPLEDSNFSVKGVKAGIAEIQPVYNWLGYPDNLQVRYPDAAHDFPEEIRKEAYSFLDDHFGFTPMNKLEFEK
jgi:pimeloyl-ACP methyl ester carboxylesterase